jgi:putative transposase
VKRSYQYRLYPTPRQQEALEKLLAAGQRLYNASLEHRLLCWRRYRIGVSYLDQAADLKAIREEFPDIGILNFSACQQVLRRLDRVYHEFIRGKRGRPRFKSLDRFRSLEFRFGDGASLTKTKRLRVQNVGEVRVRWHRELPAECTIKDLVLTRHSGDKWFVTFRLESPDPLPIQHNGPAIGVDVGLESFATLSTGEKIENPRWYRKAEERLKTAQQRYSRGKSQRKRKVLARLHSKVYRQRKDFLHKLSWRLVRDYGLIAVEDLDIKDMTSNGRRGLNKSIHDAGWGAFVNMLGYKVERTGAKLVKVNPKDTSQTCASCGQLVPKQLSDRIHDCPHCYFRCDRDLNAALVILSRATGWDAAVGPLSEKHRASAR